MFYRDNKTGTNVEIGEGIGGHIVLVREPYFVTDAELEAHFTRLDDRRARPSPRRQECRLVITARGEQRRRAVGRRRRDVVTAREDEWLARLEWERRRERTIRRSGQQSGRQRGEFQA